MPLVFAPKDGYLQAKVSCGGAEEEVGTRASDGVDSLEY
jgi:hypothetical protein